MADRFESPFDQVWGEVEEMVLAHPGVNAKEVLAQLRRRHPGSFANSQLRSLQRRLAAWRAATGEPKPSREANLHPPFASGDLPRPPLNDLPYYPEAQMPAGHPGRWNPPRLYSLRPDELTAVLDVVRNAIDEDTARALVEGFEARSRAEADMPMTVRQAAHYLGVHEQTLRKWAFEEGLVGWYDIGREGGRRNARFYRRDLDLFVKVARIEALP